MTKNRPFLFIGLIGLLILGGAYLLKNTYPEPQKTPFMAKGFSTPITFFEFIQSPVEVIDFFGLTDYDFDSENHIGKINKGIRLDFIFALIYSTFFFLFFKRLAEESEQKWYTFGMILALLAFVSDSLENIQLLGITANLQSEEFVSNLKMLPIFTWIKWGSLAIGFALFGLWLIKLEGVLRLMGYIAWIPLILGAMAFMRRGVMTELFTRSISILFFVAISYCFMYKNEMKPAKKDEAPII